MKVTGSLLKSHIKITAMKISTLDTVFEESLFAFEEESKRSPVDIAKEILDLEKKLALLQTAQKAYNLVVTLELKEGETTEDITLQQAINVIGGYGRLSKLWRDVVGKKKDRYSYNDRMEQTRKSDEERATPTISREDAFKLFEISETNAASLRAVIGVANNTEVDIPWLASL